MYGFLICIGRPALHLSFSVRNYGKGLSDHALNGTAYMSISIGSQLEAEINTWSLPKQAGGVYS